MSKSLRPPIQINIVRIALAATLGAISIVPASADEVAVYTIRSISVSAPPGAIIIHIDSVEVIEEQLSTNLSDDPARAVAVARQRLLDGGKSLQHDLASAFEDVAEAWSLGITTLPAVVVDRRYVVYGEPDIARALATVEAFRRAQP